MKLYGLIEQEWIIDERCYVGNDYSIEVFESETQRDERLLYLNGGKEYSSFDLLPSRFYEGFDIETGAYSKYNEPIEI